MDGWYEDPNDPARYRVYYQCSKCNEWELIQLEPGHSGSSGVNGWCKLCGSIHNPQSAISERTWNAKRAKPKKESFAKDKFKGSNW